MIFSGRQMEIKQRQQWIDAISCYVKGEMVDNRDDEDIAFYDYWDSCNDTYPSKYNEQLLRQVKNNGIYTIPNIDLWGGSDDEWNRWFIIEVTEVSAEAFYNEFINNSYFHWTPDNKTTITDIPGTIGKTIHISLYFVEFDYSDKTKQAIITLKDEYKKFFNEVEPIVLQCNPKEKKGICINRVFWLNSDTRELVEQEAAFENPLEINIVHKLRNLYDVVRPLLSIKRGEEIGYFNTIDIYIKDNNKIKISLRLGQCRCYDMWDYELTKTFDLDDNFESDFRSWWRIALLHQVKWLKSEINRLCQSEG